jgi:hypothetical protein
MVRAYITSAVAGIFLLGFATAALAVTGQFDNMCTMGLALGKEVKTDCSINETIAGLSYCFGDQNAKTMFMKDTEGNLAKANANYSKMKH